MQENEFEKQVKEILENYHVVPSEPVWIKIKKQLKEKRRRIWPLIFLLLVATIIAGSVIYFNNDANNISTKTTAINKQTTAGNTENIKKPENKKQQNETDKATNTPNENFKKQDVNKNSFAEKNINDDHSTLNHFIKKQNKPATNSNLYVHNHIIKTPSENLTNKTFIKQNKAAIHSSTHKPLINKNDENAAAKNLQVSQNASNNNQPKQTAIIATDSLKKITAHTDTVQKVLSQVAKTNSSKTTSTAKKIKNNALQFGVSFFAGRSNINNALFNFSANKSVYDGVAAMPGTTNNPTNAAITRPSKLYLPATSLGLGFTVDKPIAKHVYISSGLNYLYLSAKTQTGININSFAAGQNAYQPAFFLSNYTVPGNATFINKFHFIALPVLFKQDFIHAKKISVSYNAGFSVMQLISAHALIYDATQNIFYSKNSLLKHTQFQLSGGLNFQINFKNHTAISVGPQAGYSLSGFIKNAGYNSLHYNNYGVNIHWLFNHK